MLVFLFTKSTVKRESSFKTEKTKKGNFYGKVTHLTTVRKYNKDKIKPFEKNKVKKFAEKDDDLKGQFSCKHVKFKTVLFILFRTAKNLISPL